MFSRILLCLLRLVRYIKPVVSRNFRLEQVAD